MDGAQGGNGCSRDGRGLLWLPVPLASRSNPPATGVARSVRNNRNPFFSPFLSFAPEASSSIRSWKEPGVNFTGILVKSARRRRDVAYDTFRRNVSFFFSFCSLFTFRFSLVHPYLKSHFRSRLYDHRETGIFYYLVKKSHRCIRKIISSRQKLFLLTTRFVFSILSIKFYFALTFMFLMGRAPLCNYTRNWLYIFRDAAVEFEGKVRVRAKNFKHSKLTGDTCRFGDLVASRRRARGHCARRRPLVFGTKGNLVFVRVRYKYVRDSMNTRRRFESVSLHARYLFYATWDAFGPACTYARLYGYLLTVDAWVCDYGVLYNALKLWFFKWNLVSHPISMMTDT